MRCITMIWFTSSVMYHNIRPVHFADLVWLDHTLTYIQRTSCAYGHLELRKNKVKRKSAAKSELFNVHYLSQQLIRNRCRYIWLYISRVVIVPSSPWKDQTRDQVTVTSTVRISEEYCKRGGKFRLPTVAFFFFLPVPLFIYSFIHLHPLLQ